MKDSFLNFIGTLDYIDIKSDTTSTNNKTPKQNKFNEFANMWENTDITIDSIRQEAWAK